MYKNLRSKFVAEDEKDAESVFTQTVLPLGKTADKVILYPTVKKH